MSSVILDRDNVKLRAERDPETGRARISASRRFAGQLITQSIVLTTDELEHLKSILFPVADNAKNGGDFDTTEQD